MAVDVETERRDETLVGLRSKEQASVDTPLGLLVIEASERGLTHIDLVPSGSEAPGSEPAPGSVLAEAVRQFREYFAGNRREFDLPLDFEAGEFERRVLDELVRVPYGTVVSYGQLADLAGYPGAARAVGSVMRRNPFMIVVPCHRVIGADGTLRGYGGLGSGLGNKRWLLEFEGAKIA
ncbi:MAG: methylated-DNA--[protein]-cysteine S-methyltransferase [Gaiellaceae bacterium]|jgi:methylated-DNA-[protein]-cysteine S-methyltransferase